MKTSKSIFKVKSCDISSIVSQFDQFSCKDEESKERNKFDTSDSRKGRLTEAKSKPSFLYTFVNSAQFSQTTEDLRSKHKKL